MQQWNLTAERQFLGNTSVRLSYTGSRTVQQQYIRNLNLPLPSTTPYAASRRPYTNFGVISFLDQGGNSSYNAFETVVTHRSRSGLYFTWSFDWVKSLSDVGAENGSSAAPSPQSPWSRAMDKGNVAWQARLRSVTQLNWQVPIGKGRKYGASLPTAAKWVLGGWEMSDILTISSGDFLTASYSGYDSTGTSITGGRPDLIGDPKVSNPTLDRWFNLGAFAIPGANPATPLVAPASPIGRWGTSGVGNFTGPGWWQNDFSLVRQFPIHERMKLNLFILATNVFNHLNPANPATYHDHDVGRQDHLDPRRCQHLGNRAQAAHAGSPARVLTGRQVMTTGISSFGRRSLLRGALAAGASALLGKRKAAAQGVAQPVVRKTVYAWYPSRYASWDTTSIQWDALTHNLFALRRDAAGRIDRTPGGQSAADVPR